MCSFPHSPLHSFDSSRTGFMAHLISYLAVNTGLLLINLLTAPEVVWALWPLLGWGVGVLSHGLRLLAASGRTFAGRPADDGPDWARVEKRLQNLEAIVADEDLEAPASSSGSPAESAAAR